MRYTIDNNNFGLKQNFDSPWRNTKLRPLAHTTSIPAISALCKHEPLFDCHPVYTDEVAPFKVRHEQVPQTDDDQVSLQADLSTITLEDLQFPPNTYAIRSPTAYSPEEAPFFALYPPTCFEDCHWQDLWQQPTLALDLYVTPNSTSDATNRQSAVMTYLQSETQFVGMNYRLRVEEARCDKHFEIRRGDSVNFLDANRRYGRYIVDACQWIEKGCAYLPVHYREYYSQGFTDTQDPLHPSFILDIPASFCKSNIRPHLQLLTEKTHRNVFLRIIHFPVELYKCCSKSKSTNRRRLCKSRHSAMFCP